MSDYVPTVGELRQAYVEASGASMAQESYYAEQVAEFERGVARIKAEAAREALLSDEAILRALNAEEPRAATGNLADWGEQSIARMRRALTAAIGDDDE